MTDLDLAARSGAVVVQMPERGTLDVTGRDRLGWLQGLLTADVASIAEGDGRWGLALTRQGKILADVLVAPTQKSVHLGIPRLALHRICDTFRSFLVMEDAELSDVSDRFRWFTLHGVRSPEVAAEVARAVGATPASIDITGLGGAALVVPAGTADLVEAKVVELGGTVASCKEWQQLRVERLVPTFGADMDEHQNPHEASLDRRAVSWSKGCYLGQEAVFMQDKRGKVKKRLVLLRIEAGSPPPSGTSVFGPDGALAGETRSAAESPLWGGPIAIASIFAAAAAPGTRLNVGGAAAEVVEPTR